jgi:hypothetical protein
LKHFQLMKLEFCSLTSKDRKETDKIIQNDFSFQSKILYYYCMISINKIWINKINCFSFQSIVKSYNLLAYASLLPFEQLSKMLAITSTEFLMSNLNQIEILA